MFELSQPMDNEVELATVMAHYSQLGWQAMVTEVALTPKPGLVDSHNSGAHRDMSYGHFIASANAIEPWLGEFIHHGALSAMSTPSEALTGLRKIGLGCERAMFAATGGINTHKGTIFSLGLLCAAIGRSYRLQQRVTPSGLCHCVAQFSHGLVERELANGPVHLAQTAGQRLYQRYGMTGARGEAQAGYPLVIKLALPDYQQRIVAGESTQVALFNTLLLLMAHNQDTNVASRGDMAGLLWMQQRAQSIISQGGVRDSADLGKIIEFDRECIDRNLSPGGSADLLIITYFLGEIARLTS